MHRFYGFQRFHRIHGYPMKSMESNDSMGYGAYGLHCLHGIHWIVPVPPGYVLVWFGVGLAYVLYWFCDQSRLGQCPTDYSMFPFWVWWEDCAVKQNRSQQILMLFEVVDWQHATTQFKRLHKWENGEARNIIQFGSQNRSPKSVFLAFFRCLFSEVRQGGLKWSFWCPWVVPKVSPSAPKDIKSKPLAKMEVPEWSQININQENGFDDLTCKLFSYRCNDLGNSLMAQWYFCDVWSSFVPTDVLCIIRN